MKKTRGYCRICNNLDVLEKDHIPPKSCFNRDVITIYEYFGTEQLGLKYNGFEIKSICATCNRMLGDHYDPELSYFIKDVMRNFYKRHLGTITFDRLEFRFDFEKILKSIVGHLISATGYKNKIDKPYDQNENFTINKMRKVFLEDDITYFNETRIFVWIHPYRSIEVQNNFSYKSLVGERGMLLGSMIKFFPLGFLLVDKQQLSNEINLGLDEITINDNELLLNFLNVKPENYPFNLINSTFSNGAFLLNSEDGIKGIKSSTFRDSSIYKIF